MNIGRQRGCEVRLRRWAAVIAAAVGLLAATSADAQTATGAVTSRYAIADLQVPLPEGSWQAVADAEQPLRGDYPSNRIHATALIQLAGNDVAGLVLVQAVTGGRGDWGVPSDCTRTDLYDARVLSSAGSLLTLCSYVTPVIDAVTPGSSVAWSMADRVAREHGWSRPEAWLVAGFRVADDGDLLDVRYYFNPDVLPLTARPAHGDPSAVPEGGWLESLRGAAARVCRWAIGGGAAADPRWAASGWSPTAVASDPQRRAVVAALVAWTEPAARAVRSGFANRAPLVLTMPAPWAAGAMATAAPEPQTAAAGGGALQGLAFWKTVSWRIVGSSLDLLVSFGVTGSAGAAGAITIVGAAVNSVGYYLHEVAWNAYLGQRAVADLPPGGIDR